MGKNTCWPWQHKWTKWTLEDGVATNKLTGSQRDANVQYRRCEHCGLNQIEPVRGR